MNKEYLMQIYEQVQRDMQNVPEEIKWIHTTEDFFTWRDNIKTENGEDSELRNQIVENTIKGNSTLEFIYDWSKFYRMLDKSRARIVTLKTELLRKDVYSQEALKNVTFSSISPLNSYLSRNGKADIESLFAMKNIGNFGFRYNEFRSFNTPYEFLKIITNEEIYGPFAIDILVCYLRAYGVNGKDLLACGREVDTEAEKIISGLVNGSYFDNEENKEIEKVLK